MEYLKLQIITMFPPKSTSEKSLF
uniref:Uncharacterized protein n=1 Tax=Heterorhabditis bacteriophora TaxID=37862 RepID=A0A1I7W8R4_HETBA